MPLSPEACETRGSVPSGARGTRDGSAVGCFAQPSRGSEVSRGLSIKNSFSGKLFLRKEQGNGSNNRRRTHHITVESNQRSREKTFRTSFHVRLFLFCSDLFGSQTFQSLSKGGAWMNRRKGPSKRRLGNLLLREPRSSLIGSIFRGEMFVRLGIFFSRLKFLGKL